MTFEEKVLAALDGCKRDLMAEASQYRDNDVMMFDSLSIDAADVDSIRSIYEATGVFEAMVSNVMDLDTIVRDRVLEALKNAVGKEVIEATGQVIYL